MLKIAVLAAPATAATVGTEPSGNIVACESGPCTTPIGAIPGGDGYAVALAVYEGGAAPEVSFEYDEAVVTPEPEPAKKGFTIAGGRKVGVYARNDLGVTVDGTIAITAAGRTARTSFTAATITATTTGGTFTQKATLVRGGAKGFDGTSRGPGPITIGVITTVSQTLNPFCPRSNTSFTRLASQVPGHPALVARGGTFSVRASQASANEASI